MSIPIRNIYYLLAYAWGSLEESGFVDVNRLDGFEAADLLAHVLIGGTTHLLKRGLDRGYVERTEELSYIRGRLNFGETLRRQSLQRARAVCEYDDLSGNVLHNRILKTTLRRLSAVDGLRDDLKRSLLQLWRRIVDVQELELSRSQFTRVHIHRNNSGYSLIMSVCEMAYDCSVAEEGGYTSKFRDFIRDPDKMPLLFQRFVRNFYARECPHLIVGAEHIQWNMIPDSHSDSELLPRMETDITIRSSDRTWVIDTKYYAQALTSRSDTPKLISSHLYQLFAYLKNMEPLGGPDSKAEGLLLYPTSGYEIDAAYSMQDHRLRVHTVNLADDWKKIRLSLLGLLTPTASGVGSKIS